MCAVRFVDDEHVLVGYGSAFFIGHASRYPGESENLTVDDIGLRELLISRDLLVARAFVEASVTVE